MIKKVESVRQVGGNNNCVRLIESNLLDEKWVPVNFNWSTKKKFLVVLYPLSADSYLPTYDLITFKFWDDIIYNELNTLAPAPIDVTKRTVRKVEKIVQARTLFNALITDRFWTDNFTDAQNKYISWANQFCNKTVTPLKYNGGNNGDD